MAKKIYLSPSDQDKNAYAYGNTTENVQCCRIADACEKALKRCGFEVKNNQKDGMEERVAESNAWGADLHIPIHTNAYNGSVSGTRMFYYTETSKGKEACQKIFDRLAPITPGTSENIKTYPTLYELRATTGPAVYIEAEFHDVPSVAKWIIEHVEDIGEAIAHGVCDYFGVTYKTAQSAAQTVTAVSNVLYKVQVGAFGMKANADKLCKELKGKGYDAYVVEVKK